MSRSEGLEYEAPHPRKITDAHRDRLAVVYVRQSTAQQVLFHRESTRLQYGLTDAPAGAGVGRGPGAGHRRRPGQVGADAEGRAGFQRLVSEVEPRPRRAHPRGGDVAPGPLQRDWHRLLESVRALRHAPRRSDGVYDPAEYNDRLLLGLKGTMSEAELHLLNQRMHQGRFTKARRGELASRCPSATSDEPSGEVVLDPDEQVQHVVGVVFRNFEELGTLQRRCSGTWRTTTSGSAFGSATGSARASWSWRRPNRPTLHNLLRNPLYAGAYAYGRRRVDPRQAHAGSGRDTGRVSLPPRQWTVLLKDRLPAYISWEQYERNLDRLRANRARAR